ncbi:MAG TPA: peptidoglycan-binding domain-containing protein [Baekduia sp.]|nr:peptidoglycan-binding domain-containing protein [Baekduia sp.]
MRLAVAVLLAVLACTATASAATRAPKLAGIRCVPVTASSCKAGVAVRVGKQVQLRGTRLKLGMRVTFRWARGAIATKLHRGAAGWVARVPPGVRPGKVSVTTRDAAGRRSNTIKITVLPEPKPVPTPATDGTLPAAFTGNGMWIWQLEKSDGGNVEQIAARAAGAGITTVFVKAGDGATAWGQFSPLLVGALHQHGLRACAWQFVYGNNPEGEAAVGAAAAAAGADCLVIDAEGEYEGKYAAAQRYMAALRAAVGAGFPLGLTSFPYVDYHPGLPYSVFLAPGSGAQANLPQAYWKDIGGTVDAISAHTLAHNRIYGAPIAPLGQTYDNPPAADLRRFRQLWAAYGAQGLSWWSWQATDEAHWSVLNEPAPAAAVEPDPGWPALGKGAKGDEVIWLQEHLTATYPDVAVTAKYDTPTIAAVQALQTANGIAVTGVTDASTWLAALKLPFTAVDWTASPAVAVAATARAARRHKAEIARGDSARQR